MTTQLGFDFRKDVARERRLREEYQISAWEREAKEKGNDILLFDFLKFHAANPNVFRAFEAIAFAAIDAGRKRLSALLLVHMIRYNMDVKTTGELIFTQGEERKIKISNSHSPFYARLFKTKYPHLAGTFELHKRTHKDTSYGIEK